MIKKREITETLPPLSALIADDEELARKHLRRVAEAQGVVVVGETENAETTLLRIEETKPDVVFLDVQMPGMTGLQLASVVPHLSHAPLLVFVTGYSQYAAEAFDKDAVEYLLKPVSAERFARALARVRRRFAEAGRMADLEKPLDNAAKGTGGSEGMLRRVPLRGDYAVRLVPLEEIVRFEARDRAVYASTPMGEVGRTYHNLSQLEARLPAETFLRVHDSHLVNLNHVAELCFLGNHAYALRLSTNHTIPVGKTRYPSLRRHLNLDTSP